MLQRVKSHGEGQCSQNVGLDLTTTLSYAPYFGMSPPSGFILEKRAFLPYTNMALYKVPPLNLAKIQTEKKVKINGGTPVVCIWMAP